MLVLDRCVGAMLDEESGQIDITRFRHPIRCVPPMLVPGCRIGVVLDEELGPIHVNP
jgi:hypothetical protein